jgi:sodium transport system ATP-binding protein
MIEVENVSKRFGTLQALSGVSFTAQAGSITALLGPNGAGKSTCLRTLYGLLRPDEGTARIAGIDVARAPLEARRQLGVVTDEFGLYERLSPREHLRYHGRLHGLRGAPLERAIGRIIGELGMEAEADRVCKGYSAGQRIKVALARALLHEPAVLVLDEPTRGLDVMSTRAVRQALDRARVRGTAVLLSTHVMQEAAMLCDQVVVLAAGRVRFSGGAAALLAHTGRSQLEQAFVDLIGSEEGIAA